MQLKHRNISTFGLVRRRERNSRATKLYSGISTHLRRSAMAKTSTRTKMIIPNDEMSLDYSVFVHRTITRNMPHSVSLRHDRWGFSLFFVSLRFSPWHPREERQSCADKHRRQREDPLTRLFRSSSEILVVVPVDDGNRSAPWWLRWTTTFSWNNCLHKNNRTRSCPFGRSSSVERPEQEPRWRSSHSRPVMVVHTFGIVLLILYFCASIELCRTIWMATLISSSSLRKSRRWMRACASPIRTIDSICRTVTGTLPVTNDSRHYVA